jgi:hypothetical protein
MMWCVDEWTEHKVADKHKHHILILYVIGYNNKFWNREWIFKTNLILK